MRVSLFLTHHCNLRCNYCYGGRKFSRSMSEATGLKALDLAFSGRKDSPVKLSFFGGEPMLEFPLLCSLVRIARRRAVRQGREISFSITTNGTILSERHLSFLAHYDFEVAISLDGIRAHHDRHRPYADGSGSFLDVWEGLSRASQAIRRLSVIMVVNPDTLDDLPLAVEYLHDLNIRRIALQPNLSADWSDETLCRAADIYYSLSQMALQYFSSDPPLHLHPFADRLAGPGSFEHCGFGRDQVAVSPAGALYPCSVLVGEDNRTDLQIGDIDEGIRLARIRQVVAEADLRMKRCRAWTPCKCVSLQQGDYARHLQVNRFFRRLADECVAGVLREKMYDDMRARMPGRVMPFLLRRRRAWVGE